MIDSVYKRIPQLLLLVLSLIIGILQLDKTTVTQGLKATYFKDGESGVPQISRIERLATINSNDHYGVSDRSIDVQWEGYLWSDKQDTIHLSVPTYLDAHLVLNGQTVIDSMANKQGHSKSIQADVNQGLNPIMFGLSHSRLEDTYFSSGLKWETNMGSKLIPTRYLFPSRLNERQAFYAVASRYLQDILTWTTILIIAIVIITILFRNLRSCNRNEKLSLVLIVILALILRFIYLNDLVVNLPGFDALPDGSDQLVYEADARDLMRGLWPRDEDFYRQPGFTWLLGTIHLIFGDTLRSFQVLQIISGSLSTLAIYFLGKNIFNSSTAWLSAILWATFPLLIFYDTQLLTHAIEAHLTVWILCAWWSITTSRNCISLTKSTWIICALLVGIASVIRPAFLALLPLILLSLKSRLGTSRLPVKFAKLITLAAITFIPILPVTYHNYQHSGKLQLFSANGPVTLYLGNNRDSAGIGQYSPAFLATHELVNRGKTTFVKQTTNDILDEPQRWIGLMIRKMALYWGNLEIPNNVDFYTEGTSISLLLRYLPVRFGILAAIGFTGIILAIMQSTISRPGKLMVISVIGVLCITTVMFHVVSRFRVPTYGPLILFSAFAIADTAKQIINRDTQKLAKSMGVLVVSGAIVFALPHLADNSVPLPVEKHIPKESTIDKISLGNKLILESHKYTNAVEPGEPLFVTLYWSTTAPVLTEYYGSVQLIDHNGNKITQTDHKLGGASFPYHTSSSWNTDKVVRDQYLIFTPKDLAVPIALDILVVVYDKHTGDRLGEAVIDRVAITNKQTLNLSNAVTKVGARLGPASLHGYDYEIYDDTLSLTLYWNAIESSLIDGVIFIHIYDENNNFIRAHDSPPRKGAYPMGLWQPGEGIIDTHQIPIADLLKSKFNIRVGIYDPATGARMTVIDNNGNNVTDNSLYLLNIKTQ